MEVVVVAVSVLLMMGIIHLGIFDSVLTEVGYQYYAEPTQHDWYLLPESVKMPLNLMVNGGYVVIGAIWLWNVDGATLTKSDLRLFRVFAWMSIAYSPVQLARIALQTQRTAVLDQWCTLPFFMWVVVWATSLLSRWKPCLALILCILSCCSYTLTLVTDLGFEIVLSIHILLALCSAVLVYKRFPSNQAYWEFLKALLCCLGFVSLKLMDLHLPKIHPVFLRFSGHFWSKVCDFLQIHYVCRFFWFTTLVRRRSQLR